MDDGGILQVKYEPVNEMVDTVTDSAALLPFDQIQSVFEKLVLLVDNPTEYDIWNNGGNPRMTMEYHVTSVRLGLAYLPEAGDWPLGGLVVPAWDFCGYMVSQVNDEVPSTAYTDESHSFLTINAVDGTVIRREG
ncbi:MAG: DUF6034 family protein [Clostridia bacterium]